MRDLIDIILETEMSPVAAMLSEWRELTWENPLNPNKRVYGELAVVEMRTNGPRGDDNMVYLSDIRAISRGGGTETLKKIIELANKYYIGISLYSKAYDERDGSIDQKSLDRWYISNGFKEDKKSGPGWFIKLPRRVLKLSSKNRVVDIDDLVGDNVPIRIRLRGFDRKY
jgi:hypothetical protein